MHYNNKNIHTDAVIIGAGPVGIFTIFELGLWDISCHIIDVLEQPGGQCSELYPDKPIYDIPGIPEINGQDLINNLIKQSSVFSPIYHLGDQVETLEQNDDKSYSLTTREGKNFRSKIIIIAGGGGLFQPKKIPADNISLYEDFDVLYSVKNRSLFADKDLVITGGGDSALDWTIDLAKIAKSLTLVHRRKNFRGAQNSVNQVQQLIKNKQIDILIGQISKVDGSPPHLHSVEIKTGTGLITRQCDKLLVFYGLTMRPGPYADWGINSSRNLLIVDTEKFETNLPGVFAVGDINTYSGKLKLILSGFHEAALAAKAARKIVHPEKPDYLQYTTTSSDLKAKIKGT